MLPFKSSMHDVVLLAAAPQITPPRELLRELSKKELA
jgi:hypothetical protein